MKNKKNEMKIATFIDEKFNVDKIIEKHIELVTHPLEKAVGMKIVNGFPVYQKEIIREAKAAPRKAVLIPKYILLIHLIITRCRANKYHSTRLSYMAMTQTLGKHYHDMLLTLEDMGIISLTTSFKVGEFGRSIILRNLNIGYTVTQNKKVIAYSNKVHKIIGEHKEETFKDYGDDDFIKNYQNSLSLLKLTRKDDAIKYMNNRKYSSNESRDYYWGKIENFEFDTKKIYSIDKNNRIYHYLTNLPRNLKCYFNIKYQCDIHNSHPLLFSLFLINKYNIPSDVIDILLQFDMDVCKNHYLGKQLCKSLITNNIKYDSANTPIDVWKYIYSTSKGIFWDDFMDLFGEMERSEIKASMFREVFYSRKSISTRYKPFAKIFKKKYPTVWRIIKEIKKERPNELPNLMMQEESRLFKQILIECYRRNWKVVSIHDAIIVLDHQANQDFRLEELIGIITDVYAANKIRPSVSVDVFN